MNTLLESAALTVGIGSNVSGKVSSNKLAKGRSPDGHLAGRLIAKTERKREKRMRNEIDINKQKKDERRQEIKEQSCQRNWPNDRIQSFTQKIDR
jgi:hypothetical protein